MAAAMAAGTLVTSVPVYADDVEEITWMFWDDLEATEDLISKGYKEVIDRFNEEYDGKYHVTPITTNLEEYDGKLNALIAAGQTPDVYICNPGPNMDVYVNAGAAADLTDILENQEADWYASFTDGIFERMTYDGKIMAVPTNFAAACVYYNTEMFADAGVEVPTTYDELIAACQKLQDAGYTLIQTFSPAIVPSTLPWIVDILPWIADIVTAVLPCLPCLQLHDSPQPVAFRTYMPQKRPEKS